MKLSISGKNVSVSNYVRELSEKKLSKLDRYLKDDAVVQVVLSVEKTRHICEVTIPFEGAVLRGKETTGDMYASIDNVVDKLEKQIVKHRTRFEKRLREDAFIAPLDVEEPVQRRIVRTKRFAIKPMNIDEAADQMELLGHDFFVFYNAVTDDVNVLYLRDDGDLGLIEPTEEFDD